MSKNENKRSRDGECKGFTVPRKGHELRGEAPEPGYLNTREVGQSRRQKEAERPQTGLTCMC